MDSRGSILLSLFSLVILWDLLHPTVNAEWAPNTIPRANRRTGIDRDVAAMVLNKPDFSCCRDIWFFNESGDVQGRCDEKMLCCAGFRRANRAGCEQGYTNEDLHAIARYLQMYRGSLFESKV